MLQTEFISWCAFNCLHDLLAYSKLKDLSETGEQSELCAYWTAISELNMTLNETEIIFKVFNLCNYFQVTFKDLHKR
jgi:hypothetical protein